MPAYDITVSLELPGFKVTRQTSEPDGYERTVRDFPILGCLIYLRMWQRRFKCHACGKSFNEPLEAIDWEQRQPRRSQHYLIE